MAGTKIVCTMGPACEAEEVIRRMIQAGMTVARLNFSHGMADQKREMAARIRRVAAAAGRHVALLGDLQGPKIRGGRLPAEGLMLEPGQTVTLSADPADVAGPAIPFPHPDIVDDIRPGHRLLLDDGALELQAEEAAPPRLVCRVLVGGRLTSNKGVNLPGVPLSLSAITPKDEADALLALELGLDFIALSFVRRAADIVQLRQFLAEAAHASLERQTGQNPHRMPSLIAKIEKPEALDDLAAIACATDGIMVARGDLGVETAPEKVPLAQKEIIRLCNRLGKPVITATQMLQSMTDCPRPTRAEASDVANAILDGTDAVMLSGETSVGHYPVEAVEMMSRIAAELEATGYFPYNQLLELPEGEDLEPVSERVSRAISRAVVEIADEVEATAIVCSTESGRTARTVARHRPRTPVLAVTPFGETARRLNLLWGVVPVLADDFAGTDDLIRLLIRAAVRRQLASPGRQLVMTAGVPREVHGVTNILKVHTVREADLV